MASLASRGIKLHPMTTRRTISATAVIHGGSQAESVADDFKLAISPGGNTFGSVDPSAAKRGVSAGGGYLVSW